MMYSTKWFLNLKICTKGLVSIIIFYSVFYRLENFSCYGFGNVWNKIQEIKSTASCISNSYKLLSLLNLLCNTTQTSSLQSRDACYGCFFRAGSLPDGPIQLQMLSQCANLYLQGTTYAICAVQLQNLVNNVPVPTISSTVIRPCTAYCDFVRCIRRINSNTLIDNCFNENVFRYNPPVRQSRIHFYTNITACILAVTRCSQYNPITGQLQPQSATIFGTAGIGSTDRPLIGNQQIPIASNLQQYNALQISGTGEIRIIYFPVEIIPTNLFCSTTTTLQQSSYRNYIC